ncbi:hypothetical protein MLD52_07990 [Puniceicoccaceae bacterium K14]|nr:hypothetical protein [Puniceicoccaceae bacterium K14]
MCEQEERPTDEILIAQLCQLNERIRLYTSRLWQVPFLYITAIAVFNAASTEKTDKLLLQATSVALMLLGAVILYIIRTYEVRILQIGKDIESIEADLSLVESIEEQPVLPYYFVASFGLLASLASFWVYLGKSLESLKFW